MGRGVPKNFAKKDAPDESASGEEFIAPEDTSMEEPEEEGVDSVVLDEPVEEVATVKVKEVAAPIILDRNVKVITRENHRCSIGGVAYIFEKGKAQNVPMNVRDILRQADLLAPL